MRDAGLGRRDRCKLLSVLIRHCQPDQLLKIARSESAILYTEFLTEVDLEDTTALSNIEKLLECGELLTAADDGNTVRLRLLSSKPARNVLRSIMSESELGSFPLLRDLVVVAKGEVM